MSEQVTQFVGVLVSLTLALLGSGGFIAAVGLLVRSLAFMTTARASKTTAEGKAMDVTTAEHVFMLSMATASNTALTRLSELEAERIKDKTSIADLIASVATLTATLDTRNMEIVNLRSELIIIKAQLANANDQLTAVQRKLDLARDGGSTTINDAEHAANIAADKASTETVHLVDPLVSPGHTTPPYGTPIPHEPTTKPV